MPAFEVLSCRYVPDTLLPGPRVTIRAKLGGAILRLPGSRLHYVWGFTVQGDACSGLYVALGQQTRLPTDLFQTPGSALFVRNLTFGLVQTLRDDVDEGGIGIGPAPDVTVVEFFAAFAPESVPPPVRLLYHGARSLARDLPSVSVADAIMDCSAYAKSLGMRHTKHPLVHARHLLGAGKEFKVYGALKFNAERMEYRVTKLSKLLRNFAAALEAEDSGALGVVPLAPTTDGDGGASGAGGAGGAGNETSVAAPAPRTRQRAKGGKGSRRARGASGASGAAARLALYGLEDDDAEADSGGGASTSDSEEGRLGVGDDSCVAFPLDDSDGSDSSGDR